MAAWAVMKFGLGKKGIETFDFMGAGLKGKEYGVRKFKSQFGGDLVEHGRFLKVHKATLYNAAKAWFKLLNA